MRTALTVGTMVGELRKTLEVVTRWADSVSAVPGILEDVRELKEETAKLRSLYPPMRAKLDSVNEVVDDIKEETRAARRAQPPPALEVPRPRRRDDRSE